MLCCVLLGEKISRDAFLHARPLTRTRTDTHTHTCTLTQMCSVNLRAKIVEFATQRGSYTAVRGYCVKQEPESSTHMIEISSHDASVCLRVCVALFFSHSPLFTNIQVGWSTAFTELVDFLVMNIIFHLF